MAGRGCKVLNVAEKNDAARELAKVMSRGRFQRREGFSKFNKIYEFDLHILGRDCRMVMTSVSGHLLSLDFILAYKNWKNCAPGTLFTANIRKFCPEQFEPIKRTLEREVRGCQHLILWTDGDREGENIAEEIRHVCTQVKPRIQVHRARFSEITAQSITRACSSLGVLDQRVSDAVKVRQEVDLRIGCAFTRFQTMRLHQTFPSVLSGQLISYGPCQFPTLGFVVERYKQVQAFIPETFYKIKVTHETDDEKVDFNWKRVRVFNHTVCLILYQMCLRSPTARVLGTVSRPKSKWRPLPLDTVELEKQASRKMRINAKETMRIAEKLYTQGYISYPRTETNIFPDSFDLSAIIRDQSGDPDWGGFATQLVAQGPTPRRGNKTDNAHPPIHPTKYANGLQGNEKRIYEYVVRHFLACCSQDAQGQETTVEIEVAGEKFTAQGLMITARNYLDVFPYDRWTAKTIPVYQQNSTFQPSSIEMSDSETTPPPLLHEADLIALMEKHGIGTDATHAEHIETIKTRNYVGVQGDGSFVPGELGMGLVEGYDSMGYELSKPMLRAELEADLKRICEGRKQKEEVLDVTIQKYKEVFLNASQQAHKLEEALAKYFGPPQPIIEEESPLLSAVVRKCPICQQCDLVIKKKRDGGFMLSCLGYPECRAVQFFPQSVVEVEPHTSTCSICQPQPVHNLRFRFKPGSIPPSLGLEHVGCSTCDDILRDDLQFGGIRRTNPNPGDSSATASTGSSRPSGSQRQRQQTSQTSSGRGRNTSHTPAVGRSSGSQRGRGRGRGRGEGRSSGSGQWEAGGSSQPLGGRGGTQTSSGYGSAPAQSFSRSFAPTSFSSDPPSDNPPTCGCGGPAQLLTVRREDSVNKGRQFFKCSRRDGGCDFFLWADQIESGRDSSTSGHAPSTSSYGTTQSSAPAQSFSRSFAPTSFSSDPPSDNPPTCGCGGPAQLLTVRREDSVNKGRQFFKCSRRDGGCDFFLWADQIESGRDSSTSGHAPSTSSYGTTQRSSREPRGRGGGSAPSQTVMCGCGLAAVQRTVLKEGPNKGRQFYTCSKPREDQCGFFEWADDLPPSHIHSGGGSRGGARGGARGRRGGGASASGWGDGSEEGRRKRAPPTCSVCRQPGHTKRTCPQARGTDS